ncbi:MAG: ACP S-malonyltransferase [Bacteroidales bacterium]|jgi:[acyl-carrier-protein] S-malonyltransferase|nr:ACP S-malonyltransferase [Bacteroidales bacterium]
MTRAYLFPGQGAQFSGMGKALYDAHEAARQMFEKADEILGFSITDKMFSGTEEDLKATAVTQPSVFLHSVVAYTVLHGGIKPNMVAGHSLGEFSALVACQALGFEDALKLVSQRAHAMQRACNLQPSGMAVVMGFDDEKTKEICASIDDIVVAANFNCPGQLVISGTLSGIETASEAIKAAGAKRVLPLKVGGAFHSPLMLPAQEELSSAIENTKFQQPICPIYQNCTAFPTTSPEEIKKNLIAQLTAPVLWTNIVQNMIHDGATHFVEFGPGEVLQGLVKKINQEVILEGRS